MAQFGIFHHCLSLLFGKQDALQQASTDNTHLDPHAVRVPQLTLGLGENASQAGRASSDAPTRQETAIGPLRQAWVYSHFTMSTYRQHARVVTGTTAAKQQPEKPLNPLRMNPIIIVAPNHSEHMVIGQFALQDDDQRSPVSSEAGESDTSSIEAPRRQSGGPAWESDVLSNSFRSSSLCPNQSLLTTESMFGDEDNKSDLFVPSKDFGISEDNGSSGTSRTFHGSYYNDNTATIEPLIHEIDDLLDTFGYQGSQAFQIDSLMGFDSRQSVHRSQVVDALVVETDDYLDTLGARQSPDLLVDNFRRRKDFLPCAEPLPLSILKKKKPKYHGGVFSHVSAKPKGLYTIKEKEAAPPCQGSTLSDSLRKTANKDFLNASAIPQPLRIIKLGNPGAVRGQGQGCGTWPFQDNTASLTHQGAEKLRLQGEYFASSPVTDSQQIGPLFDESNFGQPVIPMPTCFSPRLTLFSEPNPLPYIELDPTQSPKLSSVQEHDAINLPLAASDWDEEDSISFLLDPIDDEPFPRCQNPVFYESAVHAWLEDSIHHQALYEASSESNDHGSQDDLGLSNSRGVDFSARRLPHVPRPPCCSQREVTLGSGHLSKIYPVEREEEAQDLDEQLRLRAQAPPCRIFLWTLHHSSQNAETEGLPA
ncbi:hypothetical protein CDEST_07768 [Colletotrichum destructivum]|uniref:Uncharacterized protein n=1 Tax=Colletotrichum destructivum TaxID=34406 RepID=A0AAX4IHK7_9PEZI|nr:hypothetical protein CDEST_07768 [Colletotrichum destructivum]